MTSKKPKPATRARSLPDLRPIALLSLIFLGLASLALKAEEEIIKSHGFSYYGELSYPADYQHFNYVNPDAPKGGSISLAAVGTFDSMNVYARKGNADSLASIFYESLLGESLVNGQQVQLPADTFGEFYGLLAHTVEYPKDKSWVIFHMRPEARFSDGTPLTAHDVAFSHNLLLDQGLKSYADAVRKRIPKTEVIDDHTIKFYFTDGISRRSLIEQVATVPVFSKAWYEETGARLDEARLTASPGSGPYVLDDVDVNRRVVYKRNPDYWGKDLPINRGRHNFDEIRIEYFGDSTAAFEAFKAGEVTFRAEGQSAIWAKGYDFPKVKKGQVKREELPNGSVPNSVGFVFNLGSEQLKDKRVRQAISLGYNFEWTNTSLQHSLFAQRTSFVQNTDMMATGLPQGAELAFLQSLGDVVPAEIFSEEVTLPHTSKPDRLSDRRNLRRAMKLLDDAGWPVGSDGKRRNDKNELLTVNFVVNSVSSPNLVAIIENYVSNLKGMGINALIDSVDSAQFSTRRRDRDYDMIYGGYRSFQDTGTGLMQFFGSEVAPFSLFNPAGFSSPFVDALIEASLATETLEEEKASIMALDRALRHEHFIVPTWFNKDHWVAYYDIYEHPDEIPPFDLGQLDFWWFNAEKAADLKAQGVLR
ncbi:extracellular solute-binding protein [Lentibacter algarum]|uniref:extracellular solute-binding protein n=1 Tax=Lentibacter algarum TaxID=576131 RepID=UPI00209097EF|nr:extracellular solute-binding protein [Lentibacter algarum]